MPFILAQTKIFIVKNAHIIHKCIQFQYDIDKNTFL